MNQIYVLVSGGAGLIGSRSDESHLSNGARVRAQHNFTSGKLSNLPAHPNLEVVVGDIRHSSATPLKMFEQLSPPVMSTLGYGLTQLLETLA